MCDFYIDVFFIGQPTSIPITVKTPKDFPIDLYYLMDLSYSMGDDLKKIRDIGQLLGMLFQNVASLTLLGEGYTRMKFTPI